MPFAAWRFKVAMSSPLNGELDRKRNIPPIHYDSYNYRETVTAGSEYELIAVKDPSEG